MIATLHEYDLAKQELVQLERWLARLQKTNPLPAKGLTKAGIRKMISRLHEELGIFEGTREIDGAQGEPNPL